MESGEPASASAVMPAGLTTAEAQRLLQQYGGNATPEIRNSILRRALGKFWAPVPWMLELAVVFELARGDYPQAAIIAILLTFNACVGFFQENRARATLEALKSRLALNASVRRDGAWMVLPADQLVPGDIIKLSLGTVVGADARLVEGNVSLDHSTLTGESLPVEGGPGTRTYAGALVRRGEAIAEVTATGAHTEFGKTAELVRIARVESSQQKAVMRVVRNLAIFDGSVVVFQVLYALFLHMPTDEVLPLLLTGVLSAVPAALPATFTLATALGARALARKGVLPTRLSAIDEAATMDILCADKTGTLTQNQLSVSAVWAMPGFDDAHVLGLAALASSEGGRDAVDAAIQEAARRARAAALPRLDRFIPFDPANKMSEARAVDMDGREVRVVKGAYAVVSGLSEPSAEAASASDALQEQGYRVLAVAAGAPGRMRIAGLVALSDPPRADSRGLVAELESMGVRTVMVTGDAPVTASVVAHDVGLVGKVCPPGAKYDGLQPNDFGVFAGVLPEDKYRIVHAFQARGHTVGMCGDGANDAPALRQAQMGIAVSTATDVAKSAAGIVLIEPGLNGIVTAVREGRIVFQRILTYVLRSLTRKIDQMLFLTFGLFITGHAILTPHLMVILMTLGDFLAMSSTTDNVRPSNKPNAWRVDNLTVVGIALGLYNVVFCSCILAFGKYHLGFDIETLRTMTAVTNVFSAQAVFYVLRDRRHMWSSRPSIWIILSSVMEMSTIGTLAALGIFMAPLPLKVVLGIFATCLVFSFSVEGLRTLLFRRFRMD
jgi:H+-transporting ATPase